MIDIHTHTPTHRGPVPESEWRINKMGRPDKAVNVAVNWDDYMKAMEPVERCVVFRTAGKGGKPFGRPESNENVNESVAAFVRAYPRKLIGFMSVHPHDENVIEEIERCVHDLGLKGVKLSPNYQNYDPLSKEAFRVYEAAQRMGLPILFHQGTSWRSAAPLRYAHPLYMDEVAMAFPELRIVMAHMGHPWQADTFVVIRKHPNVYADISANFYRPWSQYNALRLATEWKVLDKLLFGTDYPIATPQETMEGLLNVNQIVEGTALPRVPEEALQEILHRDSLTLLGLKRD